MWREWKMKERQDNERGGVRVRQEGLRPSGMKPLERGRESETRGKREKSQAERQEGPLSTCQMVRS